MLCVNVMSLTSHVRFYYYAIMKTTQITVRNVDITLKQRIDKLAKLKAMSINDFVLDTLRAKVGNSPTKPITWHHYSGVMDKYAINQSVLDDFETVDTEMWGK
jgi:hypothetical protein